MLFHEGNNIQVYINLNKRSELGGIDNIDITVFIDHLGEGEEDLIYFEKDKVLYKNYPLSAFLSHTEWQNLSTTEILIKLKSRLPERVFFNLIGWINCHTKNCKGFEYIKQIN